MRLNLGNTIAKRVTKDVIATTTVTPTIHAKEAFVVSILIIPPIPKMGAYTTALSSNTISSCTCPTSFVLLVMSEAVENLSSSKWFFPKLVDFAL